MYKYINVCMYIPHLQMQSETADRTVAVLCFYHWSNIQHKVAFAVNVILAAILTCRVGPEAPTPSQLFLLSALEAFAVTRKADVPIIGGFPVDSAPIEKCHIINNTSHKQLFRHVWVDEIRAVSSTPVITTASWNWKFPPISFLCSYIWLEGLSGRF